MVKPRTPEPVLQFIDSYCELYQDIFPEVRSFENFKYLHLGMISELKRKTLPEIAKVVGLENEQSLHHFLTKSPWRISELRNQRLEVILKFLQGREIVVIIDETGDKKKGTKTDYVKRQYIGNLGKIEQGIVAVTAYGYVDGITFPLSFEIYKPKERLKEEDKYQSKPEIAGEIIKDLQKRGLKIKLVLADSLYGESGTNFIDVLYQLKLNFAVAIRSNHAVWMLAGEKVRTNKWRKFSRKFQDETEEVRYIREIIYGRRRQECYWQITTDKETLPDNSTWYVMTYIPGVKYQDVGNIYGLRNWVEYGLKQSKYELGWADFRLTNYDSIQKWWELVISAYLMVCLHQENFNQLLIPFPEKFQQNQNWDFELGWKNILNNIRLIIQPFIFFNLIKPWLKVFPIPHLCLGFPRLISILNQCNYLQNIRYFWHDFYCSSA